MTNKKLDNFNKLVSKEKSGWLEKAKWRKENEAWLDISFGIAVKIMSVLKSNKASNKLPSNQKELAIALDCSPQYVNKLLKGAEKLNIETISKIQNALNISIINIVIKPKNIEIVAQHEEVINKKRNTHDRNYKRMDNVIQYNFQNNIKQPQLEEYRNASNE